MLTPFPPFQESRIYTLNQCVNPIQQLPFVTCIMPTANRQTFMLAAVKYFLDQDYPHKELVIIDDGSESSSYLIPTVYSLRYFYLKSAATIGMKRNIACEKAAGNIIVHWDDDDWYASNWISHQVNVLLNTEADICGLNHVQFYSVNDNRYYFTKSSSAKKNWLCGATLAYRKSFWKKYPFKNIQIGEGDFFVRNKNAKVFAHDYYKGFIATVHSSNVRIREY